MNKANLLIVLLFSSLILNAQQHIFLPDNKPSQAQKLLIKRGYGMFISYGINTFTDQEWSDGTVPASTYNPTELDCDQWVKVARDAGFRYVLLTTKHHDGFCLWDSKYTDYDVASSPVKTDIVDEVSKACKKYGLQFAVYYSLWDRHEATYKDKNPQKYIDYMLCQLTELLSNYGLVCELWLDGEWNKQAEDWGIDQIYSLVKKLQPDCAIGVNTTISKTEGVDNKVLPDYMTTDNKYYIQFFPSEFRLWDPKIAHKLDKKQYLHQGKSYYLPFEHTICISKQWTWFQKSKPLPVRDIDELEELFYWCTNNNNTLILNVAPARTGKLYEHEVNAAIALAKRINIQTNKSLPKNGKFISLQQSASASSVYRNNPNEFGANLAVDGGMQTYWMANDTLAELVISLNFKEKFNKISIFEYQDIKKGSDKYSIFRTNRIKRYNIDIWNTTKWETIYTDTNPMGDCKVIHFPKFYQTAKIRLNVLEANNLPAIFEFNVIDWSSRK